MYAQWFEYSCPSCQRQFGPADAEEIHASGRCPDCQHLVKLAARAALSRGPRGALIAIAVIGLVAAVVSWLWWDLVASALDWVGLGS